MVEKENSIDFIGKETFAILVEFLIHHKNSPRNQQFSFSCIKIYSPYESRIVTVAANRKHAVTFRFL